MAGTGKSTISRTVAKLFSQDKSLGASFFFKRGEAGRGNAMKLFTTIAWQIAISIPQLLPFIQKAVDDNPGITTKAMTEQFNKLLLQPMLDLERLNLPIQTMVIVIDALDECEGENDIRQILCDYEFFLTSRPELPIRLEFSKLANHDHIDLVLHDTPKEVIQNDISLFLNHRISDIRRGRLLPIDWPGDINLRNLVSLYTPLFIFAATICRIFEDSFWDPEDSLAEILAHRNDEPKLDGIYLPLLNRLLNGKTEERKKQLVQEFHQVVGVIVILESPLQVSSLSRLLGISERLIHLRLNPLYSILSVPDEENLPVRLFHLSFRDFLLNPETRKRTPFGVDTKEMQHSLTMKCLLMSQNLQKNICRLPSDGAQHADIDYRTINHYISPELQYACRYWAHHLVQSKNLHAMIHEAYLFLQNHFLHRMEAMSILGLIAEVLGIIHLLQSAIYMS
ncbi:hypothetical protein N7495_009751 [Penicillium taxi]|uniref:uncharacterized protein n=1 Tax=Penicillium taxi TaxID=168475 RepID=UPI0025457C84|nr:uncharacterized protein N7495_009751 [Penicillium taxi]KAJ5885241.1 hypothetical protein N7495_009751 [Penicillium taxi]